MKVSTVCENTTCKTMVRVCIGIDDERSTVRVSNLSFALTPTQARELGEKLLKCAEELDPQNLVPRRALPVYEDLVTAQGPDQATSPTSPGAPRRVLGDETPSGSKSTPERSSEPLAKPQADPYDELCANCGSRLGSHRAHKPQMCPSSLKTGPMYLETSFKKKTELRKPGEFRVGDRVLCTYSDGVGFVEGEVTRVETDKVFFTRLGGETTLQLGKETWSTPDSLVLQQTDSSQEITK